MKYTCPKCGKIIELSTEALIASEYFTVCPQCLTRLQIVGNYAYVPLADGTLELGAPSAGEAPPASDGGAPPPLPADNRDIPAPAAGGTAVDPLLGEAIKFVSRCNAITPVMLRDYFNIPMERAQALLAQLEQAGVVGPYNGGAPRSILIPHQTELPTVQRPMRSDDTGGATPQQGDPEAHEPNNKTFTFTCSGCLTWFIIISVAIMIFRSCAH